jgi:hypothetical protein
MSPDQPATAMLFKIGKWDIGINLGGAATTYGPASSLGLITVRPIGGRLARHHLDAA